MRIPSWSKFIGIGIAALFSAFVVLAVIVAIFAEPQEESPDAGDQVAAATTNAPSTGATESPLAETTTVATNTTQTLTASANAEESAPNVPVTNENGTTQSPGQSATPAGVVNTLALTEPADGTVVNSEEVLIVGQAPPEVEIRRDIRGEPDDKLNSDADGRWEYTAKLESGENSFEFFLQDAKDLRVTLTVDYERFPAGSFTVTEPADGTVVNSEEVLIVGQAPPEVEIRRDIRGEPDDKLHSDADGRWEYTAKLESGENSFEFFLQDAKDMRVRLTINYEPTGANSDAAPESGGIGNGTYAVGTDIPAGTYTAPGGDFCFFARLSGFGGTFDEIIASDNSTGPAIVTIAATDAGFETSDCGEWVLDSARSRSDPNAPFGDGTYFVPQEVGVGTWRASSDDCYWARLSGFGETIDEVIANDYSVGPTIVTIDGSEVGFESDGCGGWTKN